MRTLFALSLMTWSLAGCAGTVSTDTGDEPATGTAQPGVIARTVVRRHSDGTESVEQVQVPPRSPRAGGEVTPQAVVDNGCAGASMWLFDHNGASPGGAFPFNHEICFYNDSTAPCVELAKYTRYCYADGTSFTCANWANQEQGSLNAVQSFFAGDSAGSFAEPDPQGHGYLGDGTFGRFERVDDLDDSPAHHTLRRGKLLCFAPKN